MSSTIETSPTSTVDFTEDAHSSHDLSEVNPSPARDMEKEPASEQPQIPPQVHENYQFVQRSVLRSIVIVVVATLSMVVNIGNSTSMSIALPTIGKEFNADPSLLQWIVSAYPLSSGCLLLVCGRLADLYGRKKAYLAGTLLLATFTLGCGFANNITTLIILRSIQGIGASATIPASLGILAHSFPPSRARSFAFATFAAGAPVGGMVGLAIGGVSIEKTAKTWRTALFLFAVLNVICLTGGALCIDEDQPRPADDKGIDFLGVFLITAALVMILFVLGEGESAPNRWKTGYILALLILGVLILGIFIYWQWFLEKAQNHRQARREGKPHEGESGEPSSCKGFIDRWSDRLPPPVMKLSLWGRAKGRFAAVMGIAFLAWSSFIAWTFWVQLYYQNYAHLKPLEVVLRLIPMFVTGIFCNAFVGVMASHLPMIVLTTVGTLCTATACLLFSLIEPQDSYWVFGFSATVLSVIGVDFVFTSGTLYIAKISQPQEQSLAGALFQTMIQLGSSAGVTISTVAFNRVSSSLKSGEDVIRSYRAAQWTACGFAVFAALVSLLVFRGVGVPGYKESSSPPPQDDEDDEEARKSEEEKV